MPVDSAPILASVVSPSPGSAGVALLLVQAGASCAMAGVLWVVQLVHYPMLARIAPGQPLRHSAREHAARITPIVAPLMFVEATCAAWLLVAPPPALRWEPWLGAGLVVALWLLTFGRLVPLHGVLQQTGDVGAVGPLVRWNWPRTALWSARGVLSLWMLAEAVRAG